MTPDLFDGTTVLVTGASSGIGAALTELLAPTGARLVLVARDARRTEAVATRARALGATVDTVLADLTAPGAVAALVDQVGGRGLVVDHLMNNAGLGVRGPGAQVPVERQLHLIDLNVRAATELALRLLPGMLERRRGGILNVASAAAFQGLPGLSVYSGTKAYLLTWSEALHHELRGSGVRCTCLCPGPVDTGFFEVAAMGTPPAIYSMQAPPAVARAGLRAYGRGASHAMSGPVPRATAWLTRLAPRALSVRVAAGFARPRARL